MSRKSIIWLVLWLIFLAITIAEWAMGVEPEDLVENFLGLASPIIVSLTSRRDKR